jgi:GNAT superfamily N-acetyltransferase
MTRMMLVREAKIADAPAMAEVLRDSIRDLCVADHGGAAAPLAAWLSNKTPDNVRVWIDDRDNRLLVAEADGAIAGVGGLRHGRQVILNYVAPRFRFRGVSKQMMSELERLAAGAGAGVLSLDSTATAHAFYLAIGYIDAGAAGQKFGLPNFPMTKTLG